MQQYEDFITATKEGFWSAIKNVDHHYGLKNLRQVAYEPGVLYSVPSDALLAALCNYDLLSYTDEVDANAQEWLIGNTFSIAPPEQVDAPSEYASCLHWRPQQIVDIGRRRWNSVNSVVNWDFRLLSRSVNLLFDSPDPIVFVLDRELVDANPLRPGRDPRMLPCNTASTTPGDTDYMDDVYVDIDVTAALEAIGNDMSFITDGTLASRWMTWPVLAALIERFDTEFTSGDRPTFGVRRFYDNHFLNPMDLHRNRLLAGV